MGTGGEIWREAAAAADLAKTPVGTGGAAERLPSDSGKPLPKAVALTFDDGPHPGTTNRLLDGLRDRGARAAFFLVGEEAASNQDLVRRMGEEGHQVGNHTWSHRRLEAMERDEIAQEIGKTEALLGSILG
ncbi:MAG: polysaccharide deacetylase family protein, partial [Oscillibacter sp.]|nr:polysaccharide deacetylase family protein [Oscillibacter sp.]